jgi:hypothetical protein
MCGGEDQTRCAGILPFHVGNAAVTIGIDKRELNDVLVGFIFREIIVPLRSFHPDCLTRSFVERLASLCRDAITHGKQKRQSG